MSTLYVDNLQPNLGSQVDIPNLKPLAGSVVQVVQAGNATSLTYNSPANGSIYEVAYANITPKYSTSKMLVIVSYQFWMQMGTAAVMYGRPQINRLISGGTETTIHSGGSADQVIGSVTEWGHTAFMQFLDTPNTGQQITYKAVHYHQYMQSTGSIVFNRNGSPSKVTVMEIAQ